MYCRVLSCLVCLDGIRQPLVLIPLDRARHIAYLLQLIAQLDDREPNHPRIQAQCSLNGGLRRCRGIEAHDEVVAFGVSSLVLRRGPGQAEGPPVGVAADHATGAENLKAGSPGNPNRSSLDYGSIP